MKDLENGTEVGRLVYTKEKVDEMKSVILKLLLLVSWRQKLVRQRKMRRRK